MASVKKRLVRSKKDRILLGVLGGIAEYLEIDPTIVRILYILLCLVEPIFILAYFLIAIVMPEGEEEEITGDKIQEKIEKVTKETMERFSEIGSRDETRLLGIGLTILGLLLIVKEFTPITIRTGEVVGVLLILLGVYLIVREER
ncbi:PspC domain-containing protein [Pyrococcus sp. NA2]|uniref:PspC domain-containing protein n=1 Tax=Pyrococcus sp. (strain NA2) TaxID=342949 RepID=UPI001ED94720|nr:PspC domain-containing protein [Pyrococcus sp. NA2]